MNQNEMTEIKSTIIAMENTFVRFMNTLGLSVGIALLKKR
jgi:hypothetical protein